MIIRQDTSLGNPDVSVEATLPESCGLPRLNCKQKTKHMRRRPEGSFSLYSKNRCIPAFNPYLSSHLLLGPYARPSFEAGSAILAMSDRSRWPLPKMMASAQNSLKEGDLEEQHHFIDEELSPAPRKTSFSWKKTLTILLLIVQSLLILKLWWINQNCSILDPEHGDTIERKWIRDTSYMSLDHEYDQLWNETGQSALVYDDHKNVVQITMQVQVQVQCFSKSKLTTCKVSSAPLFSIDTQDFTGGQGGKGDRNR